MAGSDLDTPTGAVTAEDDEHREHEEPYRGSWWAFPPVRNVAVSGVVFALAFGLSLLGMGKPVTVSLFIVAALFGASHWGREALEALPKRRVSIDLLMAVATVGSAALGLWEEAAFLAFLYGAAEALEEFVYERTRGAIHALLDLAPKEATLLREGREARVHAHQIQPGDHFLVRPGESLATDGVIARGETSIDEALVTGESVPVDKQTGASVFAGTVNLTGAIEVQATRSFEENTIARIIRLVEEAQEQKTSVQRLIDRFGDRYSPAILLAALALLVVPPLLGADLHTWAIRAVTLTVAAAPCALVMSTPVAVAAAIGAAGKRGVLIKGGLHLEQLGRVRVIAFDKTGTLTQGSPEVTDVAPVGEADADTVLRLAASVDRYSEHPLARAIVRRAEAAGIGLLHVDSFQALIGAGAKARIDGREVSVTNGVEYETSSRAAVLADEYRRQGKTAVFVGSGDEVLGVLALRDEPRPTAVAAIKASRRVGIEHFVMLTGDHAATANAIAAALGIDEVRAQLRPEQKAGAIRAIEAQYGPVAMVGDGINDAPALAAAAVGIAMGTAGTDAAIEAADVALMGENLNALVYAVRLGRRVQQVSRQNVVFSIALLVVLVPAAVIGVLNIAVAVTAHEVGEIIAVLNGLRTRSAQGVEQDVSA